MTLEELLAEIRSPKKATMARQRYVRVILVMRGFCMGLGIPDTDFEATIAQDFRASVTEDRYNMAVRSVTLGFDTLVRRGSTEAEAYERMLWMVRNAYTGMLDELEWR